LSIVGDTTTCFFVASRLRKITAHVPADALAAAMRATGKGMTATVIEGLEELDRRAKRRALQVLRGKVRFNLADGTRR
jgi:hypothetical protein